jgi:1-deoxy-D-xylulose-5-phosphate synthase
MGCGTGLERLAAQYPGRLFDVGIAEGHAVSMAAGLAMQVTKPVFAVYPRSCSGRMI